MNKNEQAEFNFSEFVKQNRDKILENTVSNPTIKRDDEWVKETEWDKYNQHLMEG